MSSSLDPTNGVHHFPNERISLISDTLGLAQHFLQTYKTQRKKRKNWSHCRSTTWTALEHYPCHLIKSFANEKIEIITDLISTY